MRSSPPAKDVETYGLDLPACTVVKRIYCDFRTKNVCAAHHGRQAHHGMEWEGIDPGHRACDALEALHKVCLKSRRRPPLCGSCERVDPGDSPCQNKRRIMRARRPRGHPKLHQRQTVARAGPHIFDQPRAAPMWSRCLPKGVPCQIFLEAGGARPHLIARQVLLDQ